MDRRVISEGNICPEDDRRTQWVKPELKLLNAGSAEAALDGNADFGNAQS